MRVVRLLNSRDFDEWRAAARALLLEGTLPGEVRWEEGIGGDDLFASTTEQAIGVTRRAVGVVPRRFLDLALVAFYHDDRERLALLYRLLFRLQKHRSLIEARSDPDVSRLYRMVAEIHDDVRRSKTEAGKRLRQATNRQLR